MASAQEQVLITINAVDNASATLRKIRTTIDQMAKSATKSTQNIGKALSGNVQAASGELDTVVQQTSYSMNALGESSRLAGSKASMGFTEAAATMEKYHVGLNRVTNAMTGLFGTMGLFGMAHQSWVQSTQRQTNQVYLTMRRGTEQAKQMYSEIMQIVMELPGDDTFLTTLLTQASGRDLTMTSEGIRDLGDAIADYYVAATAKGQLTYETQRELTSYILTGETRMFTNSVLAAEIDLLKDKNTVTERATALQEALTHAGFEGMAHYKTATNAMEEFKGHFQKAFADIGSAMLPVIQALLTLYNDIDSLFGGGISASIIVLATSIAGLTTALGLIGFVTPMVNEGIRSLVLFTQVIGNVRTGIAKAGGVFSYLGQHISNIVTETKALITPMETATAVTMEQTVAQERLAMAVAQGDMHAMAEAGSNWIDTEAKIQNLLATTELTEVELALRLASEGVTIDKYAETVGLDINTKAKLNQIATTIGLTEAQLLDKALTSELTVEKYLETLEINLNTLGIDLNTGSTLDNAAAKQISIGTTIKDTASKVYNTIVTELAAIATYMLGTAEAREVAAKDSAIISSLASAKTRLGETATKVMEWISTNLLVAEEGRLNREKVKGVMTRSKEIGMSIRSVISKFNEGVANLFSAGTEATVNAAKSGGIIRTALKTGLTVVETIATYGLAAANVVLTVVLSTEFAILLAIVGVVLLLVSGFNEFGKAMGWWSDFGTFLEAVKDGIHRVWDAFVNSAPIQTIIKIFDTLSHFIGGTLNVFTDFLNNIFGGGNGGEFDFVQSLINVFGNLASILETVWKNIKEIVGIVGIVLIAVNPVLGVVLMLAGFIEDICYWIEIFEQAWDQFVGSTEFQEMMEALGEVVEAFLEPMQELWNAFADVGAAIAEAFGITDEGADDTKENINWILSGLKAIANFIRDYVAPVLKALVQFCMPILWVFRGIAAVIGLFTGKNYLANDSAINTMNNATTNYSTSTNLTKTSNSYSNNNRNVVINNNFREGAIQNNTRATTKDVNNGLVELMGYNTVYGVGGIGYK